MGPYRLLVFPLLLLAVVLVGGCASNPYALQGQVQTLQQNHTTLAQRNDELKVRADSLDRNNQELETMLAQERQQKRIFEDQVAALRDQLNVANTQLARARTDADSYTKKAETLEASLKKQVGATIRPNNSLKSALPPIQIQGVEVRQDGDVVRIELPGARLFEAGSARLLPEGTRLIDDVTAKVFAAYPEQVIGVEGHTAGDALPTGRWSSQHQLSVGMAMAVYDQVIARNQVDPNRLFLVGHGANHPVVSNATTTGRSRNHRVELVVYPERPAGR
jgi:flagellar motor protein MotB